jgi:DNA-binding LacI/PurR family transcriptional regulator
VPGALSVIGYDNIPLSGYTVPALTTVEQPKAAMGREAVTLCLRVLCGEDAASIVLQGQLILRESAGAAAARRS